MPDIDWTGILSDIAPQAIRIVVVLVLGYIMWRLVEHMAPRFIRLILRRDFQTRDAEEVGQRLDTLVSASRRISGLLILIAVTLIVLAEVGVSIAPMLAGIGIAGIAIGFASQNLVRDVLNGMIILVEDWYSKGDVVRIAGIAGLVEDITLRRTILRDLDGIVHSIPNGEVTVASNFTKDWSRVNLNVSVAYGEDLDRVMSIINQVGRQLADDPHFGTLVLEAPYALRVDSFGDSGIEIKILGNTRPLKQWEVTGELRRRIKRRFDEEQIEIPWPHTKLYFGNELEQREADKEIRSGQKHLESPTLKEAPHAMMHKERVAAI
ncbi:MAG: mechanosensitive ion channel family protein, partial [SAR202 cluster bacterium]|nr:mechanosensitive ion channel family protein [SAR202 cluster bacterium]